MPATPFSLSTATLSGGESPGPRTGAPAAALFAVLHGAGNGILTIAKGTLPLVLFGAQGYGARQGWLMMPARVAQASAPENARYTIGGARPRSVAIGWASTAGR